MRLPACFFLLMGLAASFLFGETAHPRFTFTELNQTISEDFNTYRGTLETLPSDMFVLFDSSLTNEPFQGINTGAFTAYTSDEIEYSFGIRERSPVNLQESRLFLPIRNETGQPIRFFLVSYDVEAWFIGNRRNRIRLKYDDFLTAMEAGRATFETDIFSTDNPSQTTEPNTDVDGSLAENRVTVSGVIDLTAIPTGSGNQLFGALPSGQTAWFRWQISNAAGDGGSLRSGLAINNLTITPLETLEDLVWKPGIGGNGTWTAVGGSDWSGGSWEQGRSAILGASPGTIVLEGDIEALLVRLSSNYTLAGGDAASLKAPAGFQVDEGVSATLEVQLASDQNLRKLGTGELRIVQSQIYNGLTDLVAGTLALGGDEVLPSTAPLLLTPDTLFDLQGHIQTIAGLVGERGGRVELGGGTLIIDTNGQFAYRADLAGPGNVIKRGQGSQRFRSEKKTYTGFTRIEEGVLEVTGNGEMSATSLIEILPEGELLLVGSSSSGPPSLFGAPITLRGGRLAVENIGDFQLYFVDVPVIVEVNESTLNVSGIDSFLILEEGFGGELRGPGLFRKTGAGTLELEGNHSHTGGLDIRNGTVHLLPGSSLGSGPLIFSARENNRTLRLESSHTASLLDGTAPDPEEEESENNLEIILEEANVVLTIQQPMQYDEEGNETSTRFQGEISGSGSFVKKGDGFLRFTRWPKTYTGSTTIEEGVLAVSESAALAQTSGITVLPGGQLRLSGAGQDVTYAFGGSAVRLSGQGRGGNVVSGESQGIFGALRYEPEGFGSSAFLVNSLLVENAGTVALHVAGEDNSLTLLGGIEGHGDTIVKSGGGELILTVENPALSRSWEVLTGKLTLSSGSDAGIGDIDILENGILAGSGRLRGHTRVSGSIMVAGASGSMQLDGNLALIDGGRLVWAAGSSENGSGLMVGGDFAASPGSFLEILGIPTAGTYVVAEVEGSVNGLSHLEISGLENLGFEAGLELVNGQILLTIDDSGADRFGLWINQFSVPSDQTGLFQSPTGDGVFNLAKYALGLDPTLTTPSASLPSGEVIVSHEVAYLQIVSIVRSDDPSLSVRAEFSTNLRTWMPVLSNVPDLDQNGLPEGFERRGWRVPLAGPADATILRLIVEYGGIILIL